MITHDDDGNDNGNGVLDLSVKKSLPNLLSPPSSTASSSSSSSLSVLPTVGKRMLETNSTSKVQSSSKRPLRFQCKYCDYKAPSTSLMQNHIYRHTDLTPYACAYCGHKSTTKSTIMVHIELCHPNMEVKIIENRVREQDFYRDLNNSDVNTQEPQLKKVRRAANQSETTDLTPINGVAIPLKTLIDDGHDFSPENDETTTENDHLDVDDDNEQSVITKSDQEPSTLKFKISPPSTPILDSSPNTITKESDSEDDSEYLLVYNRPKQYYGSLYEPDKQYACRICSYTTNHRPSMEDHVYVHTNEKPYKCGYCGEEIFTRYAATYHIKYKHAGMPRNFIQNKADVTQYYVNRAKKDEEKNQFKIVDTRRVKVRTRTEKKNNNHNSQAITKSEISTERPIEREPTSPPIQTKSNNPPSSSTTPDYRFLLAWSYYLATQTAWLSPMLQQQQQSASPPTDPEAAAKFLQAMQTVMNPFSADLTKAKEQIENEES